MKTQYMFAENFDSCKNVQQNLHKRFITPLVKDYLKFCVPVTSF